MRVSSIFAIMLDGTLTTIMEEDFFENTSPELAGHKGAFTEESDYVTDFEESPPSDVWIVRMEKEVAQSTRKEIIEEVVPFNHELLPQSLAPDFIRGDAGYPQCIITTHMYRVWNDNKYHLEKKTEFAVPEWKMLQQHDLEQYKDTGFSPAGNVFAHPTKICRVWVRKAWLLIRFFFDNMSEDAATIYVFFAASLSRHSRKLIGIIGVLVLLLTLSLHAAWSVPDALLDRSTAINHEAASILRNVSVREMRPRLLEVKANKLEPVKVRLMNSRLDDWANLAGHLAEAQKLMNSLAGHMDEFSLKVEIAGMEIHQAYDNALFDLRRRPDLPWSSWHKRLGGMKSPTEEEVRQGLLGGTLTLQSRLDSLIDDAGQMRRDISGVARQLKSAVKRVTQSKQIRQRELSAMMNQTSSWAAWLRHSRSGGHAKELERDIEAAEAVLEYVLMVGAFIHSIPVHEVQDDLARARRRLRALGEPSPSLKLKVYFYFLLAGITPEQQEAMERVTDLTSFFDVRPSYRLPVVDAGSTHSWR